MKILTQLENAKASLAGGIELFNEGGLEADSLKELQQHVKDLAAIAARIYGGEPEDFWSREVMQSEGLLF